MPDDREPTTAQAAGPGPLPTPGVVSDHRAGGESGPRRPRGAILPRLDRRELAAIFAGGALGTALRAVLAENFPHTVTAWPWPTFVVNVVAAFLLGYAVTRLQERLPLSSYRRPLLGTGLCGGLSTFSTMQVELVKMLDAHAYGVAAGYAAASVAAGLGGIYGATAIVRRAWTRR